MNPARSSRPERPVRRRAAVVVVLAALVAALPAATFFGGSAAAETASLPVTVTPTTPLTDLVDGSTVSFTVDAQNPPNPVASSVYGVRARLCPANVSVDFSADFNPTQLGKCILHPLSAGSDALTAVEVAPPFLTTSISFRVGVGTDTYAVQGGGTANIQCGAGHPCKVVLELQVPNTVSYTSFPLYYQGDTPPGDRFHPLAPTRILDSRGSNGGWNAKLQAGTPRNLAVRGVGGVPNTATAAVLNVTVTGGSANSFLTVYPAGSSVPNASNLNFALGQTIPNLVTVKIGTGGNVAFANAVGATDVIADVVGYYDPSAEDLFNALAPARILDSRGSNGGWNAKLQSGTPRDLTVLGVGGVPATAEAVVVNLTVTGGSANSFLTAYPAGGSVPNASNVNFGAGETIPNLATVKIGTGGKISFANAVGAVDVIADVVGYFDPTAGDKFFPLSPTRILDSRGANGGWNAKLAAGSPRDLTVATVGGVPVGASAVIANTTVTGGTANSFVTVYPAGSALPNASNVNFAAGQTIPNLVAVKLGTAGKVTFANAVGSTDVIFDLVGYYAP